jgi:hypothetical protein
MLVEDCVRRNLPKRSGGKNVSAAPEYRPSMSWEQGIEKQNVMAVESPDGFLGVLG